jgi:uncharacterized flavoprotein (TIGR03862 family)
MSQHSSQKSVAIIGGGPAGLMAAEVLVNAGLAVDLFDRMPSIGRKLLMAGKGGLNITHSEPLERFLARYGAQRERLEPMLRELPPERLREWVHALGVSTFVGSSGRVFPHEMKAAPLLRAWLHRLRAAGLRIHVRRHWSGWSANGDLQFTTRDGGEVVRPDAAVLALGGASWPQLGSDGAWIAPLAERGIAIATLRPANCGFDVAWSPHFCGRFAGQPVKPVVAACIDVQGTAHRKQGEFIVTESGVEGGLIYALSAALRDVMERDGTATLTLDLAPDHDLARLTTELARPRGSRSRSSHIQSRTGLRGVKTALLREVLSETEFDDPARLASAIKALPLTLARPRPLTEAISTAGGVSWNAVDERLMLRNLPGVFCAGEMLDWEATTGGYLLSACFATGRAAGRGVLDWLAPGR